MWGAAAALLALACAGEGAAPGPPPDYEPTFEDYRAFRAAHADLLDPNYLPFMAHTLAVPRAQGGGWALVLCRWPDERMPLPVYVAPPVVPDELQYEFAPRDPAAYATAVQEAFAMWEASLDGLVRFRTVGDPDEAELLVTLVGEKAPEPAPQVQVLGETPKHGCRVRGDGGSGRFDVEFAVHEVRVYVADQHGLLQPDQVQWVALHEIGHALGMARHSPILADLMYRVARDRVRVPELSDEDVNSFVSLYALPNGTVYTRLGDRGDPPESAGPEGAPRLAAAPYVDPSLGFELKPPEGWTRVRTRRGMVAVDGVTWDYDASFQVVVERYATIEDYLERYGDWYLATRLTREFAFTQLNGHRALRAELLTIDGVRLEKVTLLESGDGRVLVVTADCRPDREAAFEPWFEATLASLRIWDSP